MVPRHRTLREQWGVAITERSVSGLASAAARLVTTLTQQATSRASPQTHVVHEVAEPGKELTVVGVPVLGPRPGGKRRGSRMTTSMGQLAIGMATLALA